jgi:ABC-type dipeptide/oligopeptide/nickel transport system ATPase subunit/GNAT superfamily N-acetyltransferase
MKIEVDSKIEYSRRAAQIAAMFDLSLDSGSTLEWNLEVNLDRNWNVGLIVGPSGSGKTQIGKHLFKPIDDFSWNHGKSIVDDFPANLGIWEITNYLNSVGLGSVKSWLRPFRVLSNGEQFRVNLARILAEYGNLQTTDKAIFLDEFTSVIDRDVAKTTCVGIQKSLRKANQQIVFGSCHFDIIDWLQPDWILQMPICKFQWRELQCRPKIQLEIRRVGREAWVMFSQYHYLSHSLNKSSRCFIALWNNRPVAFSAWMALPGKLPMYKEHRTVTLPDFQGLGIGNALSDFVASVVIMSGYKARSTTAHPGMIFTRSKSKNWLCCSTYKNNGTHSMKNMNSGNRKTMSFEYCGPAANFDLAKEMWRKDF